MATQQIAYPLAPPALSGNALTVDVALNQPTRVTRRLMDITKQRFIVDRIFSVGGGVTGGSVVYDQMTTNELYTDRDVERVGPGDEFPLVGSQRPTPKVAQVEKWGGKFFITDEARDRNNTVFLNNQTTQLANTIVRKVNTRTVETLEAAITAQGGAGTVAGHRWDQVVTGGASQTNATGWPAADLAQAQYLADVDELGVNFNLWLVNPRERMQLALVYGSALNEVLASFGVEMYASNRITAGTAYVVAAGEVGEIRVEQALATETWRDHGTQRTWVQASVRPVMYVTNPYSIKKITGLGA